MLVCLQTRSVTTQFIKCGRVTEFVYLILRLAGSTQSPGVVPTDAIWRTFMTKKWPKWTPRRMPWMDRFACVPRIYHQLVIVYEHIRKLAEINKININSNFRGPLPKVRLCHAPVCSSMDGQIMHLCYTRVMLTSSIISPILHLSHNIAWHVSTFL